MLHRRGWQRWSDHRGIAWPAALPAPILRDIRTIENRDALIDYDARKLERDAHGVPVTRWDGETM